MLPSVVLPRLLAWLVFLLIAPSIARAGDTPARVAILSKGAWELVIERLLLDERLERTATIGSELIVVLGELEPARLGALLARVREGAGLLLVPGGAPFDLTPLGVRVTGVRTARATVMPVPGARDPLATEVVWPSAPQVGRRIGLESAGSLKPLVVEDAGKKQTGAPVLLLGKHGAGRIACRLASMAARSKAVVQVPRRQTSGSLDRNLS